MATLWLMISGLLSVIVPVTPEKTIVSAPAPALTVVSASRNDPVPESRVFVTV